jgi:hypothetical protein
MTGLDFFSAIYRKGVNLPIRIFTDGKHPNLYREHALSFCNLTLDHDDELTPDNFTLLENMDVSIVAPEMSDKVREITKALIPVRPKHIAVVAGNTFASWAPGRGWK